ncbi:DUF4843 domain-containing protein [Chitinophaga caeni]|nr:DUF4843 domain-containing protein [Chitinophaga caeni]
MKKLFFIGLCALGFFTACEKAEEITYNSNNDIYFDFEDEESGDRVDSFRYSFALYPDKSSDTIFLKVRISGERTSYDRKFKIATMGQFTTATVDLHYEPLLAEYTIPADSGSIMVPIVLLNQDPMLMDTTVRLTLQLQETSDFATSFTQLDSAKIIWSNRLEKPTWWDVWRGELGDYSRVKHELFIRTTGTTALPNDQSDYQQTPMVLYYTRRFRAFISDPFAWVAQYPDEGYVITKEDDGQYYFYNKNNPEKKYLLEYSSSDGKYFIRDENGSRIN